MTTATCEVGWNSHEKSGHSRTFLPFPCDPRLVWTGKNAYPTPSPSCTIRLASHQRWRAERRHPPTHESRRFQAGSQLGCPPDDWLQRFPASERTRCPPLPRPHLRLGLIRATRSFISLPGLNLTIVRSGMVTSESGREGFRPTFGLVRFTWNAPKFRRITSLPSET
jgi:hypothetical protein